jgi:hypothetical protein
MRWLLVFLLVLGFGGLGRCVDAHAAKPRPAVFQATPLDEEDTAVRLAWRGPAGTHLPLRARPDAGAPIVGERGFAVGERLAFSDTRVIVDRPRVVTARRHVVLASVSRYPAGVVRRPVVIPRGGVLRLYLYAGEGTCILGRGRTLYTADCPDPKDFFGRGWNGRPTPLGLQWWVRLGSGWAQVDGERLVGERYFPDAD